MSNSTIVPQATVEVKSAWASKINWTQAVSLAAMLLAYFGINMTPEVQAAILAAIVAGNTIATWIIKTWFTTTVTPASVTATTSGPAA